MIDGGRVLGLQRPTWKTVARLVIGAVVAALLFQGVLTSAGGIADAARALAGARIAWLVPSALFEVASYALFGVILARLSGRNVGWRRSTMIGVVAFGLGNVLPGTPAPGLVLAGRALRRLGMPIRRVGMVMGFVEWFLARTFLLLVLFTAVVGVATRAIPAEHRFTALAAAVVVGVVLVSTMLAAMRPGTAGRAAVLYGRIRFHHPAAEADVDRESGRRWHNEAMATVGPPARRARFMVASMLTWVADALALWCALQATGVRVSPSMLLIAYVGGIAAGMLPLLPGGIGVVEVAIPAILGWYGQPLDLSLAGVLLWRAIALYGPALVGLVFLAAMQRWPDERPDDSASDSPEALDEQERAEDDEQTEAD